MMQKWFKISMTTLVIAIFLCLTGVQATTVQNQGEPSSRKMIKVELTPINSAPVLTIQRQDSLKDNFERDSITPFWTTVGTYDWGIRDTADTYGPNTAVSGYRFAAIPENDIAEYLGNRHGGLESATIDLTGWDSLYISWFHWCDFEGTATWFDGGIVEISPDDGTTWYQIDSLAEGHLNPTYDHTLAGGSFLGSKWGYCYDTGDPIDWVNVVSGDLVDLGYVSTGDQIKIRFYFASDQLAGGNGWFIDDVMLASFAPADLQPPVIVHTPLPDTADTLNDYTVSATVTDDGAGVDPDSVYLFYKIDEGSWNSLKMNNTGGDIYEADIPMQLFHTDIYYYIEATDLAMPPNLAFTEEYWFEVTNALTIIYDEGNPYWIPGDLIPPNGLFNQFNFSDVGIDSGHLHKVMYYFDGPGPFDLEIYSWTGFQPGPLLDSLKDLTSPGYQWFMVDIHDLNVTTTNAAVVGFICGASGGDTTRVLMDPNQHFPWMWGWINSAWQSNPYTGGDLMIRLKVIPLYPDAVEEIPQETKKLFFSIAPTLTRNNTVINYQLPEAQDISIRIYDAAGKLVKTLEDAHKDAGTYQITWNGKDERNKDVASGIYFCRLHAETQNMIQKLVITH